MKLTDLPTVTELSLQLQETNEMYAKLCDAGCSCYAVVDRSSLAKNAVNQLVREMLQQYYVQQALQIKKQLKELGVDTE